MFVVSKEREQHAREIPGVMNFIIFFFQIFGWTLGELEKLEFSLVNKSIVPAYIKIKPCIIFSPDHDFRLAKSPGK